MCPFSIIHVPESVGKLEFLIASRFLDRQHAERKDG